MSGWEDSVKSIVSVSTFGMVQQQNSGVIVLMFNLLCRWGKCADALCWPVKIQFVQQ